MSETDIVSIDWPHSALLVIDMQNAFVEYGQPLCVAGAAATVPAIIRTVSLIRKKGGRVIWIRREYEPDGSDMESFRREKMQRAGMLDIMAKGSYGALPVKGLEGQPGDFVVIKKRFSGFFETDLRKYLDGHEVHSVLIAGTQTPNCVRATAFDAVSYDYRTIVIADCTSSASDAVQCSNLKDMQNAGIEVISSLSDGTEALRARFEFRIINPSETDQAINIENVCFPPNEACSAESMVERIAAASHFFLVAVDRETGKIAGFLNGIATDEQRFRDEFFTDASLNIPTGKNIMLLGLDVLPEYRRQGLARELVAEYQRRAAQDGKELLILTCLPDKVGMYKKFGFTDCGISASTWGGEEWHEMTCAVNYEAGAVHG